MNLVLKFTESLFSAVLEKFHTLHAIYSTRDLGIERATGEASPAEV